MPKTLAWYPVRVTYGRLLLLKKQLDSQKVKCFVPMLRKTKIVKEKPVTKLVPAISNYIFIYTNRTTLYTLKKELECAIPIRFLHHPVTKIPLTIPNDQMNSFIAISGTMDEQLVYLKPTELNFKKGDLVKIIDGPFKGVVGNFVRIKGDRRVVVTIEGIMAVATTFIHPSLIEPVN